MALKIRKAVEKDIDELEKLYDELADYLEEHRSYLCWKKGVYPTRSVAEEGLMDDCLYVAEDETGIVGSVILKSEIDKYYDKVKWQVDLPSSEVFVIHTFVVSVNRQRTGVAVQMLKWIDEYSKEKNIKSIRLGVVDKNIPAIRLYEQGGYNYVDKVSLGFEDIGLDFFDMYEKIID